MLHVVLYHPAIPQNVGNIARSCVGFEAHLHLIHPMSFELTDHAVRRAGLDYWPHVRLTEHADDEAFLAWLDLRDRAPWLITKLGPTRYDHAEFMDGDVLILGNENTGLPQAWHDRWDATRLHLPIIGNVRSFNVANTAAIVLATARCRVIDQGF